MNDQRMFVCLTIAMVSCNVHCILSQDTACGIEGDPRGRPRQMNHDIGPWLNIFRTMAFDANSTITRIEYYATRAGPTYVSVWWNPDHENSFEMMGKILFQAQVGQHVYEIPSADRVAVHPGYVVGIHFPNGTTQSTMTWEDPTLPASTGILHTHTMHEKTTKHRQDSGWQAGVSVSPGAWRRRAIPITVYTQHCTEESPTGNRDRPTIDSEPAVQNDDTKEHEKERDKEALAIGLAIPFTAIAATSVVIGYMMWKKKYICKTNNKIKTYIEKYEPATSHSAEDGPNDFYNLYMHYLEESEHFQYENTEHYFKDKNETDDKQMPREVRDSGYLSEHASRRQSGDTDASQGGFHSKPHNSEIACRANYDESTFAISVSDSVIYHTSEVESQSSYDIEKYHNGAISETATSHVSHKRKGVGKCTGRKPNRKYALNVDGFDRKREISPRDSKGNCVFSMYDENKDDSDGEVTLPATSNTLNGTEEAGIDLNSSIDSCDLPDNSISSQDILSGGESAC